MSLRPRLTPPPATSSPVGVSKPADGPGFKAAAEIAPLWRIVEVAHYLHCSRREVERMRSAGRLPKPDLIVGRRSPRWKSETIREWIDEQSCKGVK